MSERSPISRFFRSAYFILLFIAAFLSAAFLVEAFAVSPDHATLRGLTADVLESLADKLRPPSKLATGHPRSPATGDQRGDQ